MPKSLLLVAVALAYTMCAVLTLTPRPAPVPAAATAQRSPAARQGPLQVVAQPPPGEPTTPPPTRTPPPVPSWRPTAVPLPPGAFDFVRAYRDQCSVLLEQVPALPQERNLSCEAATARMVLAGRGLVVSEAAIIARLGNDPNPHVGYRGNVDGPFFTPGMPDYGTYAEVIARTIESFGVPARAVFGMSDDELRRTVTEGMVVIVWMTRRPEPEIIEADGYRLVAGQHVQVVVGLGTDGSFLVHDPWSARPDSGREGTSFVPEIQHWDLFDRMAVVVPM
ncbi:MAG TPA: C39 family peptidase [Anaerolineae bacterium]|nr:C39 family peptidase [Anaerolineae bacterium]HOQ99567.1 C39 family peptidase [Anaerolineae bacterium]HPL28446.1 C39 family peptidase [Anaerolineae bacterium]